MKNHKQIYFRQIKYNHPKYKIDFNQFEDKHKDLSGDVSLKSLTRFNQTDLKLSILIFIKSGKYFNLFKSTKTR